MLWKSKWFLHHMWHMLLLLHTQRQVMNAERTGLWLRQTEHIRGHLWRRYSVKVSRVLMFSSFCGEQDKCTWIPLVFWNMNYPLWVKKGVFVIILYFNHIIEGVYLVLAYFSFCNNLAILITQAILGFKHRLMSMLQVFDNLKTERLIYTIVSTLVVS